MRGVFKNIQLRNIIKDLKINLKEKIQRQLNTLISDTKQETKLLCLMHIIVTN